MVDGKAYREVHRFQSRDKAFSPDARGSGNGEMNVSIWLYLFANKSTSKGPSSSHRRLNVLASRAHSPWIGLGREAESARTFKHPGRCLGIKVILCFLQFSSISLVRARRLADLNVPCLRM